MTAFNLPGSNGQACRQRPLVMKLAGSIDEVAVAGGDRHCAAERFFHFQEAGQLIDNLIGVILFQALLLLPQSDLVSLKLKEVHQIVGHGPVKVPDLPSRLGY